jgi:4,5-DOPA dioxygenase extradiol
MGDEIPTPRAVAVMSARWEAPPPVRITGSPRPQTIHDFSGFPDELHRIEYSCPGSPELAGEITGLLAAAGIPSEVDRSRGLDHGAWCPLLRVRPGADVPVVEVSLPVPRDPRTLMAVGKALAPLRQRRVLLIGSGGVVHNLRLLQWDDKEAAVDPWAREFDDWVRARLEALDFDAIEHYRRDAPHARRAVPTTEHFDPIFFVLGAAAAGERPVDVHEGFHHGNLSMRTFAFGGPGKGPKG